MVFWSLDRGHGQHLLKGRDDVGQGPSLWATSSLHVVVLRVPLKGPQGDIGPYMCEE